MDLLDGFLQDLQNVSPRLYNKLTSTLGHDVERTFEARLFRIFAISCEDGPDALKSIQSGSTERVASMLGEGSALLDGLDAVDLDTCQPSAGVCPELMRAIACLLLCAVLGDVDAAEQSTQVVLKLWAAFAPSEETSLMVVIHLAWAKFYSVVKAAIIDGTPLLADELEKLAESMVSVDTRKEIFDLAAVEIEATSGLADFSAVGITQFQKVPVMIWPSLDNGCITQEIAGREWRLPFNLSILNCLMACRPSSMQEEGHGAEQGLLWQYWTRHLELALPRLATPPAKPFAKDIRSLGFQQLNCLVSSARDAVVRALTATGTADGEAGKLLCNLAGEVCREGPHASLAFDSLFRLLVDGERWDPRWARQDQALLPAAANLMALFRSASDGEDEASGDEASEEASEEGSEGASELTSKEASKLAAMGMMSMFVQAMCSWCVEENKPACQLRAWEAIVSESNMFFLAFSLHTLTRSPNGAEWRQLDAFGSRDLMLNNLRCIVEAFVVCHGVTLAAQVIKHLSKRTAQGVKDLLKDQKTLLNCEGAAMDMAKLTFILEVLFQEPYKFPRETFLQRSFELREECCTYFDELTVKHRDDFFTMFPAAQEALVLVHGSGEVMHFAFTFFRCISEEHKRSSLLDEFGEDLAKVRALLTRWVAETLRKAGGKT